MNDYIFSVILIILSVICIILLLLLLSRQRQSGDRALSESLRRLEQKTDSIGNLAEFNARTIENLNRATETRLTNIQARLADDIKYMADLNVQNLDSIRRTVDEKLTASLDGRLSESYARISDRLEKMYRSVGEMRNLTDNIADIKRVFTNVKLRGTWGEEQLDALLAQMLSPDQYRRNVRINPLDNAYVDFAVLLPAKDGTVLLPVDSKFPVEEFERLCQCSEQNDRDGEERARKNLERAVKLQAESISKKYVLPPATTDFAVMFLPSEALYAEVLRIPGMNDFFRLRRITVCGPTNFAALLSVLQTGFRTAAIEKRSGELGRMLEQFRVDFSRFAEGLEKTRRKLQEAQDSVDSAQKRTLTIGRQLDSFRSEGDATAALPPDRDN